MPSAACECLLAGEEDTRHDSLPHGGVLRARRGGRAVSGAEGGTGGEIAVRWEGGYNWPGSGAVVGDGGADRVGGPC